jgi:multiple sugar transport system ATP-binding protein
MANLKLSHIYKVYDNGHKAVNDFNIDIADQEFIVFVGPSGCGKSTTLRMIAGLETITAGDLFIGDTLVNDMEPKDRDIAMVFQSYALYPHLTVRENMEFPLKLKKMPKSEIDQRVSHAAETLGITQYLDRKPKALSGGQRQRVAIGRAIVREPKVLLMDEPLSNLDAKLRGSTRREILLLHKRLKATMLYVTHDQTEALTLADRIVCMSMGHVQQIGTPLELYDTPANLFVASFIGLPPMNFFDVTVEKNKLVCEDFTVQLDEKDTALLSSHNGKTITLGVRPEDIYEGGDTELLVFSNENLGQTTLVHGHAGKSKITCKFRSWCNYKDGDRIKIKFTKMHFFDKETTNAIR